MAYHDMQDEAATGMEKEGDGGGEEEVGQTALIPKALLAGKKFNPGDEVAFQIVHDYGDEVEIKYSTVKDDDEEAAPAPEGGDAGEEVPAGGGM